MTADKETKAVLAPPENKAPAWERLAALKSRVHFATRVSADEAALTKALELLSAAPRTKAPVKKNSEA